jgi:hypothetical protein
LEQATGENIMETKLEKKPDFAAPITAGAGFAVTPGDVLASAQKLASEYSDEEIDKRLRRLKAGK